ncbi:MAG: polysaccharide biosynthesis tyrosine autokinase [Ignavibacteria bacterium]|nr:polysaccharide biosynthesis tyrosine autokinase [Ignavibacteria bacterium]
MDQASMNNDNKQIPQKTNQVPSNSLKEYLGIVRSNLFPIILIFIAGIIVTLLYVVNAVDIYKTVTTVKITKPQGSILTTSLMPEAESFASDRYISNEIEILKSNSVREQVATILFDSIKNSSDKSKYFYLLSAKSGNESKPTDIKTLTAMLSGIASINQKRGLDIVEIEVQSPSNYEAVLIADVYANTYQRINLDFSRRELTTIREFLGQEKEKKFKELANAETSIRDYQQRGGIMFLDDQAKKIVDELSNYQAYKSATEVDLFSKQKAYTEIRSELDKVDKSVVDYIDGHVNESYMIELQKKVADLEIQKDLDISILSDAKLKEKVSNDYQKKINPLRKSLEERENAIKLGLLSSTPQEKSVLYQKLFETNIDILTDKAKIGSYNKVLAKNESLFDKIPAQSIELARLERDKKSNEKLYLTLEEKYQEAIVNERAQLGNVSIVDHALLSTRPSKPNRQLIVAIGAMLGLSLGIAFAFLRNYLDRSIKTPEEIELKGISVLSWVPSIEELKEVGSSQIEFIVANKPNASASESFKALRTRVMYSKLETELKVILITSSVPAEGKTTVALNLAGSFALANKKVLLLDCDLRKPRIHSIFQTERYPGLSDYLFSNVGFEDVLRSTRLENLNFITSGTIPPNPSELLGSKQMLDFLELLKTKYDIIVLDSPPFISVTDAEILSRISDGTILVVQANKTPIDAFIRTHDRIEFNESHKFLGSVLNNFSIKSAYGYYYNYYYYYSKPESKDKKKIKADIKS